MYCMMENYCFVKFLFELTIKIFVNNFTTTGMVKNIDKVIYYNLGNYFV